MSDTREATGLITVVKNVRKQEAPGIAWGGMIHRGSKTDNVLQHTMRIAIDTSNKPQEQLSRLFW